MKEVLHCFLADDDIDDRELFLMALAEISDQIRCTTATNGVEALSMLRGYSEKPAYIFLDVNMPKMNGMSCLELIRQDAAFDHCRIYLYSTTTEPAMRQKCHELRAGFIIKPISPRELKETLNSLLLLT